MATKREEKVPHRGASIKDTVSASSRGRDTRYWLHEVTDIHPPSGT